MEFCCCRNSVEELKHPWSYADLCAQSDAYYGTSGCSEGNGGLGFRPAFLDADTGIVFCSRFLDGNPAPVHLLDGLPDDVVVSRTESGQVTAVKGGSLVSGFVQIDSGLCPVTTNAMGARTTGLVIWGLLGPGETTKTWLDVLRAKDQHNRWQSVSERRRRTAEVSGFLRRR